MPAKKNNIPMQFIKKQTKKTTAFSENPHHPKITCNGKICQCGTSFSPFLILTQKSSSR